MTLQVRDNIGIAVDGGGIRGMMVARGLVELQKQLGVKRLIDDPRLKVVAGTSTGSIISSMIACGFTAEEMVDLYKNLGPEVFSAPGRLRPFGKNIPLLSRWKVPPRLFRLIEKSHFLKYALFPARYSFAPLEKLIKARMEERAKNGDLPNANPTMEQLGEFLVKQKQRDLTVVITAADVVSRRTLFVKTSLPEEESSEPDKQAAYSKARLAKMPLITAMMASSCIPTYWDPVEEIVPDIDDKPQKGYLVDGGVGNFGNPAAIVAWELCDNHRRKDLITADRENARHNPYDPQDVTIFSFGTGYMNDEMYKKQYGTPDRWWAIEWASRAIDLFMNDANRQQSRGIVTQYRGIDLRRYQIELPIMVEADDVNALDTLERLGADLLAKNIAENRHALNPDKKLRYDPEHIWNSDMERLVG
ncbi:MAG: patatin-like phospholipase family protein [Anaerolineae bacterium]|nr:patatin-like phospholipase family protein [Anaerolineae bacterium]